LDNETGDKPQSWDTSSSDEFFEYYAERSASQRDISRFCTARDYVIRVMREHNANTESLDVADIGCGAGTQSFVWSELGHRVHGLDVNEPLIRLAEQRAVEKGYDVDMRVGSATELPWADESMDVCLLPELLEHVPGWEACLSEAARVVKPGGFLYLTTNNKLCPKQQEFTLPMYSWYPGPLKRYYEKLAVTTRPELVQHATYPAVNWFTPYQLKRELRRSGFRHVYDRFDFIDATGRSALVRTAVGAIKNLPPVRFAAHVGSPYTAVLAQK
jgi:2-polyprenyl-6-hydroxyphenyl methylase/3-demethylubiquinone-9 3-methyltransferase